MHSQVSRNNRQYFLEEDRVTDDVDLNQLDGWLQEADDTDAAVLVCNQCRRVKLVGDGDRDVRHGGGVRR